jgi:hypothetical protein
MFFLEKDSAAVIAKSVTSAHKDVLLVQVLCLE